MDISKEKVNQILDNAPEGVDKKKLVNDLVNKGFNIEGLDNDAIRAQSSVVGLDRKAELKEDFQQTSQGVRGVLGEAAEDQAAAKEQKQAGEISGARNILRQVGASGRALSGSIGEIIKGGVKALLKPEDEQKVKGAVEEVVTGAIESKFGQRASADWQAFKENNPEAAQDIADSLSIAEVGADFAGVGIAGKGAKGAVKVGKEGIDTVVSAANKLTPPKLSAPKIPGGKFLKDLAEDSTPKAIDIADRQLAKSLNLAPVDDIARFKAVTKNEFGEFMARNDLIKDTTSETVQATAEFQRKNFDAKKNAISLIDERFTFKDLPEFENLVDNLITELKSGKSAEFKNHVRLLEDIKNKGEFDLNNVEFAKSLSDDIDSFYTRTGEVRGGISTQDKANIVGSTRRFIEDRVNEVYPEIKIRDLNNNTQSSRFILDTIAKRAGKGDTQSLASLGDYAVLGIGANVLPGLGIASLFGKKLLESAPVRLRIARKMYKKAGDVTTGKLNQAELKEIDDLIRKELTDDLTE